MSKVIEISLSLLLVFSVICLSLCSCSILQPNETTMVEKQVETVIEKETIIIKETVVVTESKEQNNRVSTEAASKENPDKAGFSTSDILKKAASASDKQYWVVYYAEHNNNRIEMASFNALEDFTVTYYENKDLKCDKLVGKCTIYSFEDGKNNFVEYTTATNLSGDSSIAKYKSASGIIGSNCNIYDEKNDRIIEAKTE